MEKQELTLLKSKAEFHDIRKAVNKVDEDREFDISYEAQEHGDYYEIVIRYNLVEALYWLGKYEQLYNSLTS